MAYARQQREALCDSLLEVAPGAPTLCEGWNAHDLAAHLWVRENDPISLPGMFAPPLAGLTDARMARAKARWSYGGLVEVIRQGPPRLSAFGLPGVDEAANPLEYLVHTEDVRRPNGLERRTFDPALQDWVWRRVKGAAKLLFRGGDDGLVLERTASQGRGEAFRVRPGSLTVTVVGEPVELLMYAFGRRSDADVQLVGDPEAVARLPR